MTAAEVFRGDRLVRSSMTDTWYVVTSWSHHNGDRMMLEAHVKRPAEPADFDRINARRSKPNVEHVDPTTGGRTFLCRECAVTFPDSGGLVKDPCPGCGEHVGFVRRAWMSR